MYKFVFRRNDFCILYIFHVPRHGFFLSPKTFVLQERKTLVQTQKFKIRQINFEKTEDFLFILRCDLNPALIFILLNVKFH